MRGPEETVRIVDAWLSVTPVSPHTADQTVRAVMARLPDTSQRTPGRRWPLGRTSRRPLLDRRFETMLSATRFVVAGGVLALLGGLLFSGLLAPRGEDQAPAIGASASASMTDAPSPTTVPTGQESEEPGRERMIGSGRTLSWEPVPQAEMRRIWEADVTGEPMPDIPFDDGEQPDAWASGSGWEIVTRSGTLEPRRGVPTGYRPLRIKAKRPDGSIVSSAVDLPLRATEVFAGPAGIVLETKFIIGDMDIIRLATGLERPEQCCRVRSNGNIRSNPGYGVPSKIRLRDYSDRLARIGLTPDDVAKGRYRNDAVAWHSADGETWTKVIAWPFPLSSTLLVVDDEFVGQTRDGQWLRSPDGLSWTPIAGGGSDGMRPENRVVVRWGDSVIEHKAREVRRIRPDGVSILPFATEALAPGGAVPRGELGRPLNLVAGDIGIVAFDPVHQILLFSPDGQEWSATSTEGTRIGHVRGFDGDIVAMVDDGGYLYGSTPKRAIDAVSETDRAPGVQGDDMGSD